MASLPWGLMKFSGQDDGSPAWQMMDSFLMKSRLPHVETVLADRDWLPGTSTLNYVKGQTVANPAAVGVTRSAQDAGKPQRDHQQQIGRAHV